MIPMLLVEVYTPWGRVWPPISPAMVAEEGRAAASLYATPAAAAIVSASASPMCWSPLMMPGVGNPDVAVPGLTATKPVMIVLPTLVTVEEATAAYAAAAPR